MGRGEGHIGQKRLPTGRTSEEIDGLVGELLAGKLWRRVAGSRFSVGCQILDRRAGMVVHPAEVNGPSALEAAHK